MAKKDSKSNPLKLLRIATFNGDKDRMKQIFQEHDDIDLRPVNKVENTLLHLTLQYMKSSPVEIIEILDMFISRGADPNIKNCRQETVLDLAIAKRNREIGEYLLQHGAKMDMMIDDQGNSLLHRFIKNLSGELSTTELFNDMEVHQDMREFIDWLLSKGCDCDHRNKTGQSALHLAIEKNLKPILPILLRHTRDVLYISKSYDEALIQLFFNPNIKGKYLYCFFNTSEPAISPSYNVEIVKILLEKGVSVDDVDSHDETALHLAVNETRAKVDSEIVEMLFDHFTKFHDKHEYNVAHRNSANVLTLFRLATLNGNKSRIKQIFREHIVDNLGALSDEIRNTVLHFDLQNKESSTANEIIEILDVFISQSANSSIKNRRLERALHLAIAMRNREIGEYLSQNGAKIDVIDSYGNSILHICIENLSYEYLRRANNIGIKNRRESAEFVEWLVSKGCDCDYKNRAGKSAFHLVIEYNLLHILPCLLRYTRDIDFISESNNETLLQLFLNSSYSDKYSSTVDHNNKVTSTAFSQSYDVEIVKILLDRGVSVDNVDRQELTALHSAVNAAQTKADMNAVEMLFERFSRFDDEYGHSLLCTLVFKKIPTPCYNGMLATLIKNGVHLLNNRNGWRPIYNAVVHNNYRAIELMRENNVNLSVITDNGSNLFHALADSNLDGVEKLDVKNVRYQKELFDYLMSQGCNVNLRNCEGKTPLLQAMHKGCSIAVVGKLVANGADLNCHDENGLAPLHLATFRGLQDVVRLLLDHGVNVNSKSRSGSRPIHLAVEYPKTSTLKILLRYQAEINVHDSDGNSALARAIRAGWADQVKELLTHGADVNDTCVVRAIERYRNEAQISVLQYCWKLEAGKLSCYKEYNTLFELGKHQVSFEEINREIDQLKSSYIDSRTSLYQWLHMDSSRRYIFTQNEKLRWLVDSPTLFKQLPQYSTVILGYYRETIARTQLSIEAAKEAWFKLTEFNLPDICLECIIAYLNTGYLFEMIELSEKMNKVAGAENI